MQRFGVRAIERDEQTCLAAGEGLRRGFEQAGSEGGIVGAQAGGGFHAGSGDTPVAGGRIVYRVMKARGRYSPISGRQRLQNGVAVVAIARGGGKDGSKPCRVRAGVADSLKTDRQRKLDRHANSSTLGRRQCFDGRQLRGRELECGPAAQHLARMGPAGQAGAGEADSVDMDLKRAHASTLDRTRLQLLPPKPKELLKAWRMG